MHFPAIFNAAYNDAYYIRCMCIRIPFVVSIMGHQLIDSARYLLE